MKGKKLEKHDSLAQLFFNQSDVFMVAIRSDEVVVDINKKASEILGYTINEVKGKNWFENFVPETKKEEAKHLFHYALKGNLRHLHYEHPLITKQGEELTFNFHNLLVSDEKGNTIGILSSGDEVTSRKRKEKSLKDVENRLQISLDYMIEGCQIIDYDWRYIYVNEAAAKQGRKNKEELLGYTMMQVYPGIDKTEMFSHLRNCMANRVRYQLDNEFTFTDGSKGIFELRINPVPVGILILSIDITRSRELEAELNNYRHRLEHVLAERTADCAKANEKLTQEIQEHKKTKEGLKLRATILDNVREAIFLLNDKGDFQYANEAASRAYGYTVDELLNMNIRSLMPKKDESSVDSLLKHIVEKGETIIEMIHLRSNKSLMHVKLYSNLAKTLRGQFIVIVIRESYD